LLKLYRTNMAKTPLEDFTTEILAGILENDSALSDDFANNVLNIQGNDFSVYTQQSYPLNDDSCPDCRVDLVIESEDVICFVEIKVESKEGYIQLERYGRVLDSLDAKKRKYLRYCTKYYDLKETEVHNFHQFRWTDVSKFLKSRNTSAIINDYLKFLKIHDMSDDMDFQLNDLLSLQQMTAVINLMDRYLNKLRPLFSKLFGDNFKEISNLRQIKLHSRHILVSENVCGNGYSEMGLGFSFNDVPELKVWVWISPKNDVSSGFKKATETVNDPMLTNGEDWIGLSTPLSNFLSSENMELDIEKWFDISAKEIKAFTQATPQLNWHI